MARFVALVTVDTNRCSVAFTQIGRPVEVMRLSTRCQRSFKMPHLRSSKNSPTPGCKER